MEFLCLIGSGKDARVKSRDVSFPLTKRGCEALGAYLYTRGVDEWMHSSSCDFPQEYKKWFKYDVRDLIVSGYNNANLDSILKYLP